MVNPVAHQHVDRPRQPHAIARVMGLLAACAAVAFIFGYRGVSENYGLGQPGLLLMAIPAGVLGFLLRRPFRGVCAAPLIALSGAMGLCMRMDPAPEVLVAVFGISAGLGGLVAVVAGALGGFLGDRYS